MAPPPLGFKKMFSLRFPSPKGVFAERLPISVQRRTDDLKWKITGNPKDKSSPGTLRMINYMVVYLHKKCLYICVFVCACVHLPMCAQMYVCMHVCMQVSITTSNYSKMRNLIRRSRNLRNIWFGLVLANGQNACDDGPIKKGALQCTAQDPPAGTSRQSETSKPQAACLKKSGEALSAKKSKEKD